MSRRGLDLNNLVKSYKDVNKTKKLVTEQVKKLGDDIKSEFVTRGICEYEHDGIIAKVTEIEKVNFNEDYAIETIKQHYPQLAEKLIQTKEYINEDLLESEIYNDSEFGKMLQKAFTTKIEKRLNIK